ncbi:MAG: T9SS type A sorting domain-containing protein [Ignavibacteriae bacterium]|nr:T9SS type A sorting domain-containing protein [Ignavibacteriota bacterium]
MSKVVITLFAVCCLASVVQAQTERTDAIWARTTTDPITLDGVLNEAAWAVAESVMVVYGEPGLMPGGGSVRENGVEPSDLTMATIKFLVWNDSLYVAVIAKDSSVGGGLFNKFDGFLINIRNRVAGGTEGIRSNSAYQGAFEYFYGWVTEPWADPETGNIGALPNFFGFAGGHRDSIQTNEWHTGMRKGDIWDAVTTVDGITNTDTVADVGYTTEFKFNLAIREYDVTNPTGEIVMFSMSLYDADWQWPIDSTKFSGTRSWLQCPWGNASQFGHMNLLVDPTVTTSTAVLPDLIGPDLVVLNGENLPAPVIDGALDEQVWYNAPSFQIEYGNSTTRNGYPNVGKYRSGQWQFPIDGVTASVQDANVATVKYFFREDTLYLAFDVADQFVQYRSNPDQQDGFRITINDREKTRTGPFSIPFGQFVWTYKFAVDSAGSANPRLLGDGNTTELDTLGVIWSALELKPNTTVDTLGAQFDEGYTAEVAIDLTKIGYPAGGGDGVVFLGLNHFDGDSYSNSADNTATITWWFRELQEFDGPAWLYLDPTIMVPTGIDDTPGAIPASFELVGNYPNPFNPATVVQYTMPHVGTVKLFVYDVLGRRVATVDGGQQQPGVRELSFDARGISSGMYFYYLEMTGASNKSTLRTKAGKMLLVK